MANPTPRQADAADAAKSGASAAADYADLAVPTAWAPGLLGQGAGAIPGLGITTRGLHDAMVVGLGVGMGIVGVVLIVRSTPAAKSTFNLARKAVAL